MGTKITLTRESISGHIDSYIKVIEPSNQHAYLERFASFDFCFNYFRSFYEAEQIIEIASRDNIEKSVLQLCQYLASWGMYRGSTALLRHSSYCLVPLIRCIANTHKAAWEIDIDNYHEKIEILESLYLAIGNSIDFSITKDEDNTLQRPTHILITKIMLGVFGNTPALDNYFMRGIGQSQFVNDGFDKSLKKVVEIWRELYQFYIDNKKEFDNYRIETLDFNKITNTGIFYTKAKLIDMLFFIEGRNKNNQVK